MLSGVSIIGVPLSGVSNITTAVDRVFLIFLVTVVILFGLIVSLLVIFAIKYHRSRNPVAADIEGSTTLEVVWTVIPLLLVLGLFYFGWQGSRAANQIPEDALEVKVTAMMWQWRFEYPNGIVSDELKVPVDRPVRLRLVSLDVIHSFFVPAFRLKEDVVPGMDRYTWFQAEKVGAYDILCAEYCGLNHAYMRSKVQVMPQEAFDAWYQAGPPASEAKSSASNASEAKPAEAEPNTPTDREK